MTIEWLLCMYNHTTN